MLYSYGFLHNGLRLSAHINAFEFAHTQDRAYGLLLKSSDKLLFFFGLYQRILRTSSGSFSALKRVICRPSSMHLRPNTQECRTEGEKKRSLKEDKAAQSLWTDLKTHCTLEEDHCDWRAETTFIYHATLSHTATSDFKPSHPTTSSPKPPPAFLSHKSSSSHRPVGAEQGDTPPC